MLKNILAITGKPGLFKLVSRGNNMLIVESLVDGKRMPTYARDKIVSLAEVSMFTTGEDIALSEVLNKLGAKQSFQRVDMDIKSADNDTLRQFFAEVLPDFDRDRVYPSDIRKLIQWYNILISAGFTDFTIKDDEGGDVAEPKAAEAEPQKAAKTVAPKQRVNASSAKKTTVKTGVGAKKG